MIPSSIISKYPQQNSPILNHRENQAVGRRDTAIAQV
jgi:hypothetical protein